MCDCIKKVNRMLAKENTTIVTVTAIHPSGWVEERLCVPTGRVDTRKRKAPLRLFATFCPMCGVEYPKSDAFRSDEDLGATMEAS